MGLLGGLTAGFIYVLVAAGLWLVWRYAGVANFAHSEVAMVAAFTAYSLERRAGWLFAIAAATAAAVALTLIVASLAGRGGQRSIAVTFAVMLALRGTAGLVWGDQPSRWSGPWQQPLGPAAPAGLTWLAVGLALLAAVTVVALVLWLQRSRAGLRLRALASEPDLAVLTGTTPAARVAAWLAAGVLAVPAGIGAAFAGVLEPGFMADWTLPAFVLVLAVPRLRLWALLPAGLALGVTEQLLGRFTPPGTRDLLLLAVLAVLIRWRAGADGTGEPA